MNNGASSIGFAFSAFRTFNYPYAGGSPRGVIDPTNHFLYVSDPSNNRVLVFTLTSGNLLSSKTPTYVLGQPNFDSCAPVYSQSGLNVPSGLALDVADQLLYVADYGNARVLVFNVSSISNGMNASYILGQASFTGNGGWSCSQSSFGLPFDVAFDATNNRLFVSSTFCNTVYVFNTSSLSNDMNAAKILGSSSFAAASASTTQSTFNLPVGLAFDTADQLLYVADLTNNRVLQFNVAPGTIANGENASYVLGQSNYTTATAATTQSGMSSPTGLAFDAGNDRLFAADYGNNRVLVFPAAPGTIANGENASYVLGQSGYTSSTAATTQSGMYFPAGPIYDSTNSLLYVADTANNRLLEFNVATGTIANGENASDLLGQYSNGTSTTTVAWTQNGENNGPNALGFTQTLYVTPSGSVMDSINHYFYVSDPSNNRVLIYALNTDNSFPTASGGHTASYVLGQTSLWGKNVGGNYPSGLGNPIGMAVDSANHRLFVTDTANSYVFVYNTSSLSNGMSASNYLGIGYYNDSQSGLEGASYVAYDAVNSRLFVSDEGNNRVVVFNVAPGSITNSENASYVLGQTNFTNNSPATTQSGLNAPYGIAFDPVNENLYVADLRNNRVLVFNVAPGTIANGENASYVIGQASFTTNTVATTQSGLNAPYGIAFDPNTSRLFVADAGNSRILVFNAGPNTISNGMNASYVLGQTSFTTNTSATTQSGLTLPTNVYYDPGSSHLFVNDASNNRVLIFEGSFAPSWTPGYD